MRAEFNPIGVARVVNHLLDINTARWPGKADIVGIEGNRIDILGKDNIHMIEAGFLPSRRSMTGYIQTGHLYNKAALVNVFRGFARIIIQILVHQLAVGGFDLRSDQQRIPAGLILRINHNAVPVFFLILKINAIDCYLARRTCQTDIIRGKTRCFNLHTEDDINMIHPSFNGVIRFMLKYHQSRRRHGELTGIYIRRGFAVDSVAVLVHLVAEHIFDIRTDLHAVIPHLILGSKLYLVTVVGQFFHAVNNYYAAFGIPKLDIFLGNTAC